MEILSHASAKKGKQKGLKVSNFALLWVVFKWPHGSEGVKIAWSCSAKQLRLLRQDLTKVFLCWGYSASQAGWSMLMKLTADWLVNSSDVIGPLWGVSTCRVKEETAITEDKRLFYWPDGASSIAVGPTWCASVANCQRFGHGQPAVWLLRTELSKGIFTKWSIAKLVELY